MDIWWYSHTSGFCFVSYFLMLVQSSGYIGCHKTVEYKKKTASVKRYLFLLFAQTRYFFLYLQLRLLNNYEPVINYHIK